MKRLIACLLATSSIACAGDAAAQACCRDNETPRWYAGLSGSLVFLQETDFKHSIPYPFADRQTFKMGYGFGGSVGYRIFPNIRTELEVTERVSDVSHDTAIFAVGSGTGSETQKSTAFMANVFYDFHNKTLLTPYIGAGIGEVYVKNPRLYGNAGGPYSKELDAWTLGYQYMAGVTYEFNTDFTPFELSLGYRFFSGQNVSVAVPILHSNVSFSNESHNVELGGRMFF